MTFREALVAGPLLLDGATGSELIARGYPAGRPPALWSVERPDAVRGLAAEYVDAGARVVLTNTFCAAPAFVESFGIDSSILIERAVSLAREAAGDRAFVAASMSVWSPEASSSADGGDAYRRQAALFARCGADALVLETLVSIDELRTAVRAANLERGAVPLVGCMTFDAELRSVDGTMPEEMAWVLEDLGADAVGVNCCDGPETVLRVVEALARATDLPIWAKPNAGLPGMRVDDEEFAAMAIRIVEAGASAIGGCCGTTPRTIRRLGQALLSRDASI